MYDIVNYSEELFGKLQKECDFLVSDRLATRDVLDARSRALAVMRDEELRRAEQVYEQQKSAINEIFSALLTDVEADQSRNEENLMHITGETDSSSKTESTAETQAWAAE